MIKQFFLKFLSLIFLIFVGSLGVYAENHNVLQVLEALQQDIKTLERAVYSNSFEKKK